VTISRRTFLLRAAAGSAAASLRPGAAVSALARLGDAERERVETWLRTLRSEGFTDPRAPLGSAVARAGELALGTPYEAHTLERYLAEGGRPADEPLTLRVTVFDCVTLVESAIALARTARAPDPGWERFATEVERMRYRGGLRRGYASRLHYFSEWIVDGAGRGLLREIGSTVGGVPDPRPLRFMTVHRASYAALADGETFRHVGLRERALDEVPRHVVPADRIHAAARRLRAGDVLAFATGIEGLDVTHTGVAHLDRSGTLGVLHAPLSGGVVERPVGSIERYVAGLRGCTGLLVARPLPG
jgi:cell wall-associated NlpC family hydrolase